MNKKKHSPHDNLTGAIQSLIGAFRSGFLRPRSQNNETEPVAENLGRGTATGPAEVRPSEHTHHNSNTSDTYDQSVINWQSFDLADAYKERPPIEFVVGNIFPLPSLSIVYGSPGSFKSFLLADLVCCVAGGIDWLPPFGDLLGKGQPVTQGGAVWIDFDNGRTRTLDRFKALGTAMDLPEDVPLKIYSMPYPVFDARNLAHIIELQALIALHDAGLVIIDNLAMISGDADENSADMAEIFNNLRQISEITRTAIVVIHHPRKGSQTQGRAGDRLRGHSSIEAAIDLALYMERSGNNLTVDIKPTKARDSLVETFSARFDFEVDQDNQLIKARFYSITGGIDNRTVMVMDAIWEALADGEFNKGDLSKDVRILLEDTDVKNIGINKIGEIIEEMHEQGFLKMRKGDNNARLYSRNSDKPYEKFSDEKGVSQ
jgi:hypothetical protein